MTKTEHYNLNQWEKSDRIQMTDFNADNLKLDAALKANADAIAAGAKLAYGTYLGTGGTGNNGVSLTFPFKPRFVAIFNNALPRYFTLSPLPESDSTTDNRYIAVLSVASNGTVSGSNASFVLQSNTLLLRASDAAWGLNTSGASYHYIAIG